MTKKMLIIDDETLVLESCRKVFEPEGYEVVCTTSPEEGMRLASDAKFEVILCDWKMPGFDGMNVVEELDRRTPESALVMISGYPAVERATEAMKRGAMDYVSKPFKPEEIVEVVNRAQKRKISEEKKAIGKFEKIMKSWQFPLPPLEDKAPRTIAETVASTVGVGKATSPWFTVFVLGILAGSYIGFGGLLSTTVTFDLAAKAGIGLTKFMAGSVFSLGLILVVIAGAELFTGNNLMVSSVLTREITFSTMTKRWILVYAANFIGAILVASIFYFSGLWKTGNSALGYAAIGIAAKKVSLDFSEALVSGIGCNWLVCLAVWMALAARQIISKIFAIFFPIMAFVAIGFEHCVANMYFIPTGIFLKNWAEIGSASMAGLDGLTWVNFVWKNLLPVTIGNILGGAVFVGMSYWGAYLRPSPAKRSMA
ncbi:MAG: histidine kinase [Deltaproteobacteria bacterium HGW-Deltaproteobacteria-21]|nr:MAG: histidine kinase [Deltaproteobacteria bacterium HGW-Deltaproteobacteria-21]